MMDMLFEQIGYSTKQKTRTSTKTKSTTATSLLTEGFVSALHDARRRAARRRCTTNASTAHIAAAARRARAVAEAAVRAVLLRHADATRDAVRRRHTRLVRTWLWRRGDCRRRIRIGIWIWSSDCRNAATDRRVERLAVNGAFL